jgi:hypothetical protein
VCAASEEGARAWLEGVRIRMIDKSEARTMAKVFDVGTSSSFGGFQSLPLDIKRREVLRSSANSSWDRKGWLGCVLRSR